MGSVAFADAVRRIWAETVASFSASGPLGTLLTRAERDRALRQRFVAEPMRVLAEWGVQLPTGMKVRVVENDEKTVHLVLPASAVAAASEEADK